MKQKNFKKSLALITLIVLFLFTMPTSVLATSDLTQDNSIYSSPWIKSFTLSNTCIIPDTDEQKDYKVPNPNPNPKLDPTPIYIPVNHGSYRTIKNAEIKQSMNETSPTITTIAMGKEIPIYLYKDGWYKTKYKNKIGYVKSENIYTPKVTREDLIETGLKLVGKIPYFWGGKSPAGWDSRWNKPMKITSKGSSNTGKTLPYGLDCSGFVGWVFETAGLGKTLSQGGTYYQWENSYSIDESEAIPGDLVFKQPPQNKGINHVGIYLGKNKDGKHTFLHISSKKGVSIDTPDTFKHFHYFRRPYVNFSEDE